MSLGLLTALSLTASAHVPDWAKPLEINPALGVPGFPDCERDATLAAAGAEPEMALRCAQKEAKDDGVISIGCVGDSITAGVCSTGGKCVTPSWPYPHPLRCHPSSPLRPLTRAGGGRRSHTYPAQLQIALGEGYKVTNLGACGSTMMKGADSPFWK